MSNIKNLLSRFRSGWDITLYISDFLLNVDTMKDWIKDNLPNFNYTGNIYWWNKVI